MESFKALQARYAQSVERALEWYMQTAEIPGLLAESMRYSLFAGGKRLRPCLTLAACALFRGDAERALPFACALEMIHTYSLIHDDLPAMDNDDFRRGKPTCHRVYGEGQAILAGDGLLSYAFEIMLETLLHCGGEGMLRAARAVARGAGIGGMVSGQCLDLQYASGAGADEEILRRIHYGKTAAMLIASAEAGAYAADAEETQVAALRAFGKAYGLLFQITDDILDAVGSETQLGKSTGKDQRDGKLTYMSRYGLETAKKLARDAAEEARAAIREINGDTAYFQELIAYTLTRRS